MVKLKKKIFLLKKRKFYQRLDIYPFLIIILAIIIYYSFVLKNQIINTFYLGIVFALEIIIFFSKFLSVDILIKFCYFHVDSVDDAKDVRVDIFSENIDININRTIICKIIRENNIIKIEIEKLIYIYDEESKEFVHSKFSILKKNKVGKFLQSKPLSKEEVQERKTLFGENKIKIPIPSFFKLYIEHIFTPFFMFQVLCIILRIFDNYSYNLISLILTCIFEITIAGQRLFNLATLRNMRISPHYVYAYRDNEWVEIPSTQLLPGDIVSVTDGSSLKNFKEEDKDTENNLIFRLIKKLKEMKKTEEETKNQKSINTVLNKYKEKEILPVTCDMLILSGSVIVNESMLTGESIPKIKDSVIKSEHLRNFVLDTKFKHKNLIIFAGTKVVEAERDEKIEQLPKNVKKAPPDNGVICLVIKTGFYTTQGKLLHKVLFSEERIKEQNKKEAYILMGILLIIALIASCYVLIEFVKSEEMLSYKLLLRCLIIITSIVPSDLPIELSLIINKSLSFFESKKIVCIEPFRIPLAGKIDICCFDKTETLTSDEYIVKGVIDTDMYEPEYAFDCNEKAFSVLLGCNSLINIDGRIAGDPIDIAIFKEIGGKFDNDEIICKRKTKIESLKKYIFESDLKRMTIVAKVYSENHQKYPYIRVLCKGAPEIIKNLLKEVPLNYDECYLKWAKMGYRILSMAYKDINKFENSSNRAELEKDLIFCGFIIVEAPLKDNIDKYIKELNKAKYDICIITGDHLLTTLKVSRDLKIGPDKFALLKNEEKIIKWYDIDNNLVKETRTVEEVKLLSKEYTLGLNGDEYNKINSYEIIQYIKLFCRVNQFQKNSIIKDLIKCGKYPSMCGDGSNDVGALKLATIGVVLLNVKENKMQKKQPFNFLFFDDDATIKNWDATAVASFTSKSDSIKCIKNIFVQGRCALVINIQMYKIFILNSIITIFFESVLFFKGIKLSENQFVYFGFIISMFFKMLSKARPLKKVNSNKPPKTIFTLYSFISIIGQVIIQLISLFLVIYCTVEVDPFLIESLDEKFSPNLINTIMFLFLIFNQTIIFIVNYQGEPFMENILDNSSMVKLIGAIFALGSVIIFDLYPQLNEDIELVSLPEDNTYKIKLLIIMLTNFALCYIVEKWRNLMGYYEPFEKVKSKKKKNQ